MQHLDLPVSRNLYKGRGDNYDIYLRLSIYVYDELNNFTNVYKYCITSVEEIMTFYLFETISICI